MHSLDWRELICVLWLPIAISFFESYYHKQLSNSYLSLAYCSATGPTFYLVKWSDGIQSGNQFLTFHCSKLLASSTVGKSKAQHLFQSASTCLANFMFCNWHIFPVIAYPWGILRKIWHDIQVVLQYLCNH